MVDPMNPEQNAPESGKTRWVVRGDIVTAGILDVLLVVAFAIYGRASHDLELSVTGVLTTAWPFFIGLWVGWVPTWTRRKPLALWPTAVWVWVATAGIGLGLRYLTSDFSVAPAFVLAATGMLAALLIGWRVIFFIVRIISTRMRSN